MRNNALAALFVFILTTFMFTNDVFAGAWTVPKYKVWLEYYTKISTANEYFNVNGNLKSIPSSGSAAFKDQLLTMEPKMEFGVTDWLTAMTSLEYKQEWYKEYDVPRHFGYLPVSQYTVKNNGIVNVKVGGRWRIIDDPFVLSLQSRIFIYPGYGINHNEGWKRISAFRFVQDRQHLPAIGYGNDSFEQRVLIGKSFSIPVTERFKLPCYAGAETGYRWNNRNVCSGIPWFMEGGFWPFSWLLLKTELDAYNCQANTGKIQEGSYGIWRGGAVWQVFGGDSVLREGNKLFNLEFDYGITAWGKNTTAYQEYTMKVQTQF